MNCEYFAEKIINFEVLFLFLKIFLYLCMKNTRNMKRWNCLLMLVPILLFNCRSKINKESLFEVDSLIVHEQYDSAYHLITTKFASVVLSPEGQAHYNLLKVQTAYLVNKPLAMSDSILDEVIFYYDQHTNIEKLADAYYYKALGYSIKHDFSKSILLYKKAEQLADKTGNRYLLYKIFEGIAYVNMICGKYDLQQNYAKKALEMAIIIGQKHWIAYSYYNLAFADLELGFEDSAVICLKRIPPYIKYVNKSEKPILLSSMGYLLLDNNPEEAKSYLYESLKYQELTATYMYLAEICEEEGEADNAYEYWKKALLTKDTSPKDAAIRNIIEYDMKRGKTDSICERINEIIAIRDSIDAKLKNDTIKDLQTRFDHEVAMREKDQIVIKWQWIAMALIALLLAGIVYYLFKKYQTRIRLQNSQMQINDYMEQIRALQSDKGNRTIEIERLNKQIERIMEEKSPRLLQGRMLYDMVVANKKMSRWKKDDVKKFIEYYTATNYRVVNRLRSIPRKEEMTPHHLLYLILQEMGKTDQEIRLILSISKETLRTLRFRTKPLDEEISDKTDQTL